MENNKIQAFNNEEFGEVRTVMVSGEPWFVGKDVAVALGYTNPQKAIRDHVDDEDRTVNESFTVNGTMGVLINESGLYSLVMSSKLPDARKLKRWITSEVIPITIIAEDFGRSWSKGHENLRRDLRNSD